MDSYSNPYRIPIGVFMESLWNHCGILMESLWNGIPMEWNPYGILMESVWDPMESFRNFMEPIWNPCVIPKASLWNPCGAHIETILNPY